MLLWGDWITFYKAKGILIILTVIGHIWQSGPVFNIIYAFHMPAFFLISGFLLQYTCSYKKAFSTFLNTIIIYGTHHIIYATIGMLLGVSDFTSTPIFPGIIMLMGVLLIEIPVIYLINHWAPWLAGKHRQKLITCPK